MDEKVIICRKAAVSGLRKKTAVPRVLAPHRLGQLPDALQAVLVTTPDQLQALICRTGARSDYVNPCRAGVDSCAGVDGPRLAPQLTCFVIHVAPGNASQVQQPFQVGGAALRCQVLRCLGAHPVPALITVLYSAQNAILSTLGAAERPICSLVS